MIEHNLLPKRTHRIKTTVSQLHTTAKHERYDLLAEYRTAKNKRLRAISTTKSATQKQQARDFSLRTSFAKKQQIRDFSMRTSFAKKQQSMFLSYPQTTSNYIFHLVDRGNNEDLISQLLVQRGNWTRNDGKSIADTHFIWGSVGSRFRNRLNGKQILSRVRGSQAITEKGNLYDNLCRYSHHKKIQLNFVPITFHLKREGPQHELKQNIKEFVQFFNYVDSHTTLSNTWIMKPTNMNQGRDIHLFNSIKSLLNLLKFKKHLFAERSDEKDSTNIETAIQDYVRSNRSLIIQKYIQNPYLVNGHKFDIRIWVLLDQQRNYYVFQEGYLRFSSQPYKLSSNTITDNYMHLTNHSLQKHSPNYSQTHSIQPISTLKDCLESKGKAHQFDHIISQINSIISITMKGGFPQQKQPTQKSFELFGYDFMVDRELNVRLLEVNSNPAITLDCPLLEQLVPKMLNDMMKLTIDKLCRTKNIKNYNVTRLKSINSWTLLGNLYQNQ